MSGEREFWVRQRRLAQPAFHRQRVASYAAAMVDDTERMMGSWAAGEAQNTHDDMMRRTPEFVAKTLFDAEIAGEANAAIERPLE